MKKQYDGMKAEKVEFNYEENVVASGNNNWYCQPGCGKWEGNLQEWNMRCCYWVSNSDCNQK